MKVKQRPEDFQVEELSDFAADGGPFALYRLNKRSLGTPEAVDAVVRRWKLRREAVSVGGLKDRHAVTSQWLTIRNGPRRDFHHTHFELVYQGQASRPFVSADIAANRFQVVVRDLDEPELERARRAMDELPQSGLPNYFDRQRFGSVGQSGDFVARAWCAGDYSRALWLALADPHEFDRSRDRAEKQLLRDHWGDWRRLESLLRPSPRRTVVSWLAERPGDLRRAMAQLPQDLRSLYLAAFQSFVWNRILAELLRGQCRPEQLVDLLVDDQPLPFFRTLEDRQLAELRAVQLPLPSARARLEEGPVKTLIERALAPFGLEMRALRIKYPRDSFFSKGDRPALVFAEGLEHESGPDELQPGRRKLTLRFSLPRGSYATILITRISACPTTSPLPSRERGRG